MFMCLTCRAAAAAALLPHAGKQQSPATAAHPAAAPSQLTLLLKALQAT
jgi:hypothetical protein